MNPHKSSSKAVSITPAGPRSMAFLYELAQGGSLDQQTRIRIALYLAQRGQGVFQSASLRDCGRAAGMNGAEMAANGEGTSHDAKGTVCLQFVRNLLDDPRAPSTLAVQDMVEVGYRPGQIAEVIAQVGVNMVLAGMNRLSHSPGAIADCGQMYPQLSHAS